MLFIYHPKWHSFPPSILPLPQSVKQNTKSRNFQIENNLWIDREREAKCLKIFAVSADVCWIFYHITANVLAKTETIDEKRRLTIVVRMGKKIAFGSAILCFFKKRQRKIAKNCPIAAATAAKCVLVFIYYSKKAYLLSVSRTASSRQHNVISQLLFVIFLRLDLLLKFINFRLEKSTTWNSQNRFNEGSILTSNSVIYCRFARRKQ